MVPRFASSEQLRLELRLTPCVCVRILPQYDSRHAGIYVHNAEVGNGKTDSLFMEINKQCDALAANISGDPKLANGFDIIGHSQGGLLTRCYVERYNDPPVHNLISWAGPEQGVYGVPDFNIPWLDKIMSE